MMHIFHTVSLMFADAIRFPDIPNRHFCPWQDTKYKKSDGCVGSQGVFGFRDSTSLQSRRCSARAFERKEGGGFARCPQPSQVLLYALLKINVHGLFYSDSFMTAAAADTQAFSYRAGQCTVGGFITCGPMLLGLCLRLFTRKSLSRLRPTSMRCLIAKFARKSWHIFDKMHLLYIYAYI